MADTKTLREQAANAATEARSLLDQIKGNTDEARTADLESQHDKAMGDYDKFTASADAEDKRAAFHAKVEADAEAREKLARENKRPGSNTSEATQSGEMTRSQAFREYLCASGNLAAMSADARSVWEGGYQSLESRAQTTTAAAGGYTVPTEMASFIVKSLAAHGPMYDGNVTSEIVTSGGGQITIPTVNDTSRVIAKTAEGTTLTDDGGVDVTFGQKTLDAYAYDTEWLRISKPLVDDSAFNMEQFIGELLGEGLARRVNTELTTGDGTGDPNGVVTASALGKTAAGVAAVTGDEIIDLLHAVDPQYRSSPKCRWMFNDSVLAIIRKLKDGDGNYLWQMGDIRAGEPASLLGYAYSVNQAMAAMTTGNKTILFGDFGKYYVRKAGGVMIGAITDKDFWPGIGIAGYVRLDGELADTAAVKHMIQA